MEPGRKFILGIGMFGLAAPLYLIPNHFPVLTPLPLPLTPVDQWLPFLPESIWIYLSEYVLVFSAYFLVKDPETTRRYLKGTLTLLMGSALVFFLFPTTYPRNLFPIPEEVGSFTRFLLELQRAGDTPNNCFPSLHVATVFMAAFTLKGHSRWYRVYLFWAILISISTLTTKQHYLWDGISGGVLALGLDWIFIRRRNEF